MTRSYRRGPRAISGLTGSTRRRRPAVPTPRRHDDGQQSKESWRGTRTSPFKLPATLVSPGSRPDRAAVTCPDGAAASLPIRHPGIGTDVGKGVGRAGPQRVEDLGYSTLTMPDHFGDQLAPMPALMAAADATTTLRVGALVFDNDYKHPVVLAKELATIDLLSGGRLEVGIGAGWMATDYEQSGIPYDRAGVRVDRFEEGLAVIKGLFADGPVLLRRASTTRSPASTASRSRCSSRTRRSSSAAAASACSSSPPARPTSSASTRSLRRRRDRPGGPRPMPPRRGRREGRVGEARRRRPRSPTLELNVPGVLRRASPTTATAPPRRSPAAFGMTPDEVARRPPSRSMGTVEQIIETLHRARRERWGFSYVIVGTDDVEPFAPVVAALSGT